MIGAVQLGVLAAFIVVLVPMGLAGWHLSRNKMLFFSGALFISLAVAVHLSPYFPSLSDFIPSTITPSSVVVLRNRDPCLPLLHQIEWTQGQGTDVPFGSNGTRSSSAWKWARSDPRVVACDFQKIPKSDARILLKGSWVVVAGDSQARLFALSLLGLVLEGTDEEKMDSIRSDLFKRHSDYQTVIDGVGLKLNFIWAPYLANLTAFLGGLDRHKEYPDVMVMGSGLWHMLHVNDAIDYGDSLEVLSKALDSLLVPFSSSAAVLERADDVGSVSTATTRSRPHLFWLGLPVLINSMLNTEEKREKMTSVVQDAYERSIHSSKLLTESGGPFFLLDIRALSGNCGYICTEDGMHYNGVVYQAAVHIMLNALLIESQQKL